MRLTAALGISALLHAAVGSVVTGGAVGGTPRVPPQSFLTVRLVGLPAHPDELVVAVQDERVREPTRSRRTGAIQSASSDVAIDARGVESLGTGATVEGPDTTYYPARQLDVYPALSSALDLSAARTPPLAQPHSRALLLVLIDEAGVVKDASVIEGEPVTDFEDARQAFLAARFTPAYRNGRPVRSRVLVEVNYSDAPAPR